ncbi:MAG: hypothetical protein ABI867_10770 [Kofleriaceae bacterium]
MHRCALVCVALSCSGEAPPAAPAKPATTQDAGVDGITDIGSVEPGALDGDPRNPRVAAQRFKNRPPRPIDVVLKTEPPGAIAAVDGVEIGVTPTYWYGESDGREHEFTFVLRNHAVARYRFVPIQSGTVHARLDPIAADPVVGKRDPMTPSGVLEPAPSPVPPPPTVITPDTP